MKTRNRSRYHHNHNVSARRTNPKWRETGSNAEYNINDDVHDDRFSHGYKNSDYSRKNFWYGDDDNNRNPNRGYNNEYNSNDDQFGAYGRGEFDSGEEFRSHDNRYGHGSEERFSNQGYKRRRDNEPNPYYTDKYYYNPSNYDEGSYRNNRRASEENQYNNFDNSNEDDYDYDYYESYPRYNQVSEKDDRYRRSSAYTYGNEKNRNVNSVYHPDYKRNANSKRMPVRRSRRPNIRDKKY